MTADWRDRWAKKTAWTLREFAMLCCGWDPDGPVLDRRAFDDALSKIEAAVASGELPTMTPEDHNAH